MIENLIRDEATNEIVRRHFGGFHGYIERRPRDARWRGRRVAQVARAQRARAAIGHALAFETWRSLVRENRASDDAEAVEADERTSSRPRSTRGPSPPV